MLSKLTDRLFAEWDDLFPGARRPGTIRYLGLPGSVEGGTTTFLAFSDALRKPLFAVKIHRDAEDGSSALNEQDVLSYIHARGSSLGHMIPRVILCERISSVWMLVQSILDGHPMLAAMTSDGVPETRAAAANLRLASDCLRSLYRATQDRDLGAADAIRVELLKAIEEFAGIFDCSSEERDFLAEVRGSLRNALPGSGLCVGHGDFCRHNLLVSRDHGRAAVGVIDWTFGKRAALPLNDLLNFITTYFLQNRKHHGLFGFTRAFEYTFFEENDYRRLVMRHLAGYCDHLQIPLSSLAPLFGMLLIEKSVLEYHQVMRCGRRGGLPRITVYLASLQNRTYHEAMKEQLWVYFFRLLSRRRKELLA